MRTSHRRVSTTEEGRAVLCQQYTEMEIAVKNGDFSGICKESKRVNLLPGFIQISKHIFRCKSSQNIPPKEASNGRGKQHRLLDFKWLRGKKG